MSIQALTGASRNRSGVTKLISENVNNSPNGVFNWLGGNFTLETSIAMAMFMKASRFIELDNKSAYGQFEEGTPACQLFGTDISGVNVPAVGGNVTQESVAFFLMLRQSYINADAYILDLFACHQVSPLKESNIHGYFMERSGTDIDGGKVLKVLNALYGMLPSLVQDEDLRTELVTSTFATYHIAASSTPNLVLKFINEQRAVAEAMLTQADIQAAQAASDDIWDLSLSRLISPKCIVITGAYLKANGSLPDNWYQFARAKASTSTVVYATALTFFVKLSDIQSDVVGMNSCGTQDQLIAAMPATLRR